MSKSQRAPPRVGNNRPKRKADVLTEASSVPQPQGRQISRSFTEIEIGQSKKIKLSAQDLLATVSRRRISITKIEFSGNSSKDGGTYADVAVATLIGTSCGRTKRRTVAVKKLRFVLSDGMTEEKFLRVFVNELHVLDKLSHPNIVEIIGFVEDIENRIAWLVFPWEENGNLREFLRSGKWELPERVSLIQDVARGLEYLHTQDPPICHGDLKSLNILVNLEHRALITDFGSARVTQEIRVLEADPATPPAASASRNPPKTKDLQFNFAASETTLTLTGPQCSFRWAPPDVLNGGPLDLASDIWALGWIAWEAITDSHPFEELDLESAVIVRIIEGRLPLLHDHSQLSQIHSLCSLMLSCWKPEPKERPSATECSRNLQWIPSVAPALKDGEQSTIRSPMIFLQLGEIHRLQNRNEEATKMYEQGLAIARSTGDQAAVALLSVQLAETQRMQCKYVQAEAGYTQALAIHTSLGNHWGRAHALRGLGDIQIVGFNYVYAEAYYTQAMAIYATIGSDLGRANALVGLGGLQRARSHYVDAKSSYTQAMAINTSIGNDAGRADAILGLGDVHLADSNYVDAETSYTQATTIYTSIGNDWGRANALLGLGEAQQALSNYVDAEASYTQAMATYTSVANDWGRADASLGLGEVQQALSNDVDAEASYAQAIAIYTGVGNHQGRADALYGLGDVQRAQSNYVDAEASYTQAIAIYASIGDGLGRAGTLSELGDVQTELSNYVDAEESYTQAIIIYASIGLDSLGQASALLKLGEVQEMICKYDDAEASCTQAIAIYASIGDDLGRATSYLVLSRIRLCQARYLESKALINDAARISEQIHDIFGERLWSQFLEEVLEAERSSTEPRLLPPASPDMTHAEDINVTSLSSQAIDTSMADSAICPL